MRTKQITFNLKGKTPDDIDSALDEAIRKLKEGFIGMRDENDTGGYSFSVDDGFEVIAVEDITEEAEHIASQLNDITEDMLCKFAASPDGGDLPDDDFGGYIEGNIASVVQVLIDENGGAYNDGDKTVAEKLNNFFDLDPQLTTLNEGSSMKP